MKSKECGGIKNDVVTGNLRIVSFKKKKILKEEVKAGQVST